MLHDWLSNPYVLAIVVGAGAPLAGLGCCALAVLFAARRRHREAWLSLGAAMTLLLAGFWFVGRVLG